MAEKNRRLKDQVFPVRLTKDMIKIFQIVADERGITIGKYLRDAGLGTRSASCRRQSGRGTRGRICHRTLGIAHPCWFSTCRFSATVPGRGAVLLHAPLA